MIRLLVLLCISTIAWAGEPTIRPATRTHQPINQIRKIFYQIPIVSAERVALGLPPVINLSIGQPHISMQTKVLDPFISYLENLKGLSPEQLSLEMGYSHSAGIAETRVWISRFFTESFPEVSEGFTPDEVMVTNGGTGALTNALKVLIEQEDDVAVFAPYFAAYENQVKSCGGTLVAIPLILKRPRADVLDDYLASRPKIKAFIWNDPNNPLGTKAEREELQALADVLKKYPNLIVIHDEVYRDTVHNGNPLSLINIAPELKPRSFIIRSLAKDVLGAPGIRAGMISAPTNILTEDGTRINFIELMSNEQLRDITSVSILVQKMLSIAIEQKLSGMIGSWELAMTKEYANNTKFVVDALADLGLYPLQAPKGAFFVMIDASPLLGKKIPKKIGPIDHLDSKVSKEIRNDLDIAAFFLHAAGVAVVPGSGFGIEHCSFRISCARPKEQLIQATERMKQAVQNAGFCSRD